MKCLVPLFDDFQPIDQNLHAIAVDVARGMEVSLNKVTGPTGSSNPEPFLNVLQVTHVIFSTENERYSFSSFVEPDELCSALFLSEVFLAPELADKRLGGGVSKSLIVEGLEYYRGFKQLLAFCVWTSSESAITVAHCGKCLSLRINIYCVVDGPTCSPPWIVEVAHSGFWVELDRVYESNPDISTEQPLYYTSMGNEFLLKRGVQSTCRDSILYWEPVSEFLPIVFTRDD